MLQQVEICSLDLNPYREWVNAGTFRDLERLGIRLRGLKVWHVNATSRKRDTDGSGNTKPDHLLNAFGMTFANRHIILRLSVNSHPGGMF